MREFIAVVLIASLASAAGAQEPSTRPAGVEAGARVRASAPATGIVTGRVVEAGRDSLAVARDHGADTVRLALNQLTSLDVSTGRHKRRWRGAGFGFLGGAALGAVLGAATYRKPECSGDTYFCDLGQGFDAAFGAVLLGGAGAVAGAIVGGGSTDDWQPVVLRHALRLELNVPRSRRRLELGASLRL